MAFNGMGAFLDELERAGELLRVRETVSCDLEIAAVSEKMMKEQGGGKALLFEKVIRVDGSPSAFPVCVNLFGSENRMRLALGGKTPDEIAGEIAVLLKAKLPKSGREAWELLKIAFGAAQAFPHPAINPCKRVIYSGEDLKKFDLSHLPVLKCWPKDGGPFVTLPTVYTADPDTGTRNIGMYRIQVYDGLSTGMHWQTHKVGARHGKRFREKGEIMPVAVCLGGDPLYTFAATAPMPDGFDEILLAGFLRGRSVAMIPCRTQPIKVPDDSDFVIEGFVDPSEPLRDEGPFGDHTGFYTPVDKYPVFHVTAISHRADAVYPATVVGKPPMEDYYMGTASVRLFLPVIKMHFPEIVDIALPMEGVFHNLVFVSIKKQYPWQAFKIMNGLWGMGQMMFSKIIVVVDESVCVHNLSEVIFHLCANIDPARDILFTKGPVDSLDHATATPDIGSHMGIDATTKLQSEGYARQWPDQVEMPESVRGRAAEILARLRAGMKSNNEI